MIWVANLTADSYIEDIAEPYLILYLRTLKISAFQQDNAQLHIAKISSDFFSYNEINLPPRSPDLLSIEYMRDIINLQLNLQINLYQIPQILTEDTRLMRHEMSYFRVSNSSNKMYISRRINE